MPRSKLVSQIYPATTPSNLQGVLDAWPYLTRGLSQFAYDTQNILNDQVVEGHAYNHLIDGAFNLWDFGTSLSAGTGKRYLSNVWFVDSNGSTITPSRLSVTPDALSLPQRAKYAHRCVVSSSVGAGNYALMGQSIMGVLTGTVTLSLYCQAASEGTLGIDFVQNFGSGGTPSASVVSDLNMVPVAAGFNRYACTFELPSLEGKVFGTTDNTARTDLRIWFDQGSNFGDMGHQSGTFDVACILLDVGDIASDFIVPDLVLERDRSEYFIESSGNAGVTFSPGTGGVEYWVHPTSAFGIRRQWRHVKRIIPTFTMNDAANASGKFTYYIAGWNNGGTEAALTIDRHGYLIQHAQASSWATTYAWKADARFY